MNEPMPWLRHCLEMIDAKPEPHRTIDLNAVRAEIDRLQGGCPCERLAGSTGEERCVTAIVVHGHHASFARVRVQNDAETLCGQGPAVADAIQGLVRQGN